MKKVGILTFHDGINYGGFLQLYGLYRTIESLGHEPVVINYRNKRFFFKELRMLFLKKRPQVIWHNFQKLRKFRGELATLRMTPFGFDSGFIPGLGLDAIVVGSDEVWNYTNPVIGKDLTYFGRNLKAPKVLSYAASCGSAPVDKPLDADILESMRTFDHMAVRDENSFQIVKRNLGKEPELVLDPTFLVDFPPRGERPKTRNAIVVYATLLPPETVERLRLFARQRGKRLVALGYNHPWADQNVIDPGPFEWLEHIRTADMVVSATFHGTIFSILFRKPFCSIVSRFWSNKLGHLLKSLDLSERLDQGTSFEEIFSRNIDWERVETNIAEGRARSIDYLRTSLG